MDYESYLIQHSAQWLGYTCSSRESTHVKQVGRSAAKHLAVRSEKDRESEARFTSFLLLRGVILYAQLIQHDSDSRLTVSECGFRLRKQL